MKMKTLFFLCLIFAVSFSLKSKIHLKKTALCSNPIYIINSLDFKFLDLSQMTTGSTCTLTISTRANVIMSRSLASWCYSIYSNLRYNGINDGKKNACPVSLYGDSYGDFEGMVSQAMMNTNWLMWSIKALGNGFSAIYSMGPNGTISNLVLTWDGSKFSLAVYSGTKGQKWLVANAIN